MFIYNKTDAKSDTYFKRLFSWFRYCLYV